MRQYRPTHAKKSRDDGRARRGWSGLEVRERMAMVRMEDERANEMVDMLCIERVEVRDWYGLVSV